MVGSTKTHAAMVGPTSSIVQDGSRAGFIVIIKNEGSEDLVFSSEDVAARLLQGAPEKGSPLKVYGYEERLLEETKRVNAARGSEGANS